MATIITLLFFIIVIVGFINLSSAGVITTTASNSTLSRQQRIDELMPDELEDDSASVNNDGLGGDPDGLVEDIIVGKPLASNTHQQIKERRDNCTKTVLTSLVMTHNAAGTSKLPVTWSTVVNSYSFDLEKNQLTLVADFILSWSFELPNWNEACENTVTLLVEPASLIWTPRFVFLNNLDAIGNLLPSEMWDKWPAVVHLDKRLITWHFATRITVACSFQASDSSLISICPVKIAGLITDSAMTRSAAASVVDDQQQPSFIFQPGELSVLTGDQQQQQVKFSIEANAANDLPALVLLARLDLTNFLTSTGGSPNNFWQPNFRIFRIKILSFRSEEQTENNSASSHYLINWANLSCFLTFFGSFLVFLLSSVSITLVVLSWQEKQQRQTAGALAISNNKTLLSTNTTITTTTNNNNDNDNDNDNNDPPKYESVLKESGDAEELLLQQPHKKITQHVHADSNGDLI